MISKGGRRPFETISASSITTFLDCPRKWYFRYILGEKGPETAAMAHGTKIHADIEAYYRGQKPAPASIEAIEAKNNGLLPDRSLVYDVELKAQDLGLKIFGLDFLGFIDLVYFDENGDLAVRDWKTRSAFTYAPDAIALLDDIQGRLYGWIGFQVAPGQQKIRFSHGNMIRVDGKRGRNSPRSQLITCVYNREEIDRWIATDLKKIVDEMRAVAVQKRPNSVRMEQGSCFKYGKCEYKEDPIASLRGRSCYDIPYQPAGLARQAGKLAELNLG